MKTDILGIKVDTCTASEALDILIGFLNGNTPNSIFTPNPEMIMAAVKDSNFAGVLNSASLVIPDGIGVVMASRLNMDKIKERVPGCDLILAAFDYMKDSGHTAYLFGAAPGVALKAKCCLEKKFRGLKIVGVSDGYYDDEKEKLIIKDIQAKKPDLLVVGTGMVRQEAWIRDNMDILGAKALIGAGGSIDVFAGNVKRAPDFWRKTGFEWLYRMFALKRFKRQVQIPLFILAVLKNKLQGKK